VSARYAADKRALLARSSQFEQSKNSLLGRFVQSGRIELQGGARDVRALTA